MSDAPGRQMRVLIVDDHELVRVGMPTLLSTDPEIEVLGGATTGAEAIAMAREKQPDMVLVDAHLLANEGVLRSTADAAPLVSKRFLGLVLDACRAEGATPCLPGPPPAQRYPAAVWSGRRSRTGHSRRR
jgi:hypothetical protein